jgi:hypothetical protein
MPVLHEHFHHTFNGSPADRTRWRPEVNFSNMFIRSFYVSRSQKRKNSVKLSVPFCTLGMCWCRSFTKNVDEIDSSSQFHQHFTSNFSPAQTLCYSTSISPTILHPTIPVHLTGCFALRCAPIRSAYIYCIKAVHGTLMKLTPVANVTNVLYAAFTQIVFCKK